MSSSDACIVYTRRQLSIAKLVRKSPGPIDYVTDFAIFDRLVHLLC
jgi:hypothetical protein